MVRSMVSLRLQKLTLIRRPSVKRGPIVTCKRENYEVKLSNVEGNILSTH